MKITIELLTRLRICQADVQCILALPTDDPIEVIKALHKHRFERANRLLARLLTPRNAVRYAVYAAKQILPVFENCMRNLIEATDKWLGEPTEKNIAKVEAAMRVVYDYHNTHTPSYYNLLRLVDVVAHVANAAIHAALAADYTADAAHVTTASANMLIARAADETDGAAARAANAAREAVWLARGDGYTAVDQEIINYGLRLLRQQLKGE